MCFYLTFGESGSNPSHSTTPNSSRSFKTFLLLLLLSPGVKWETKSDSLGVGHYSGDNMAIGFSIERSMAG